MFKLFIPVLDANQSDPAGVDSNSRFRGKNNAGKARKLHLKCSLPALRSRNKIRVLKNPGAFSGIKIIRRHVNNCFLGNVSVFKEFGFHFKGDSIGILQAYRKAADLRELIREEIFHGKHFPLDEIHVAPG